MDRVEVAAMCLQGVLHRVGMYQEWDLNKEGPGPDVWRKNLISEAYRLADALIEGLEAREKV